MELTRTVNSIRGTLSHQLFESLNTRVRGHYQRTDLLEGSETATGEGLSLAYRKRLPARSFFTFNVDANHEEVERDVVGTRLPVREELHPGVQQGDLIRLDQLGPLDSVLSVKSRLPDLTYLEGRDYRVNTVLGGIEILAGGTILPGTDLFISYQVLVNPQITFTTDTLTLGSSLSLWQNRYVISGEYVKTDTGSTGIGDPSLYDTTSARLRLDANYEVHKLSAEFADFERGTTRFSYLSGEWRYTKKLPAADLSLFVQDRYSQRETVAPGGGSSDTNDFGAGSSYAGRLFSWGRFTTAVNYTNSTSSSGSSNYLYLKAGLDGRFNQLTLTLAGQSVWRISGSETSRDDNLHFELSRTFY